MGCNSVRPLLPAYGDNELSIESAIEVERHLLGCPHCDAVLERHRRFTKTIGQLFPRAPLLLASDLTGQGGQACAVCHAGMAQRTTIESLEAGNI